MEFLPWLMLFLGAIGRIFLPFLLKLRDNPNLQASDFNMRYVWPMLISLAIFILVLPVLVDNLAGVADLDLQYAWLSGYGAASFGRLGDKTVGVIRA